MIGNFPATNCQFSPIIGGRLNVGVPAIGCMRLLLFSKAKSGNTFYLIYYLQVHSVMYPSDKPCP